MNKLKTLAVFGGVVFFIVNWLMGNRLLKWYKSLQKTVKWIISGITISLFVISFFKSPDSFSATDVLISLINGKVPETKTVYTDNYSKKDNNNEKDNKVKRNVNGYMKRLVAHNQDWMCKKCGNKLDPMFETDHVIPLYKGGTNDVDNLQALCRNCHGKKTMMDVIKGE